MFKLFFLELSTREPSLLHSHGVGVSHGTLRGPSINARLSEWIPSRSEIAAPGILGRKHENFKGIVEIHLGEL